MARGFTNSVINLFGLIKTIATLAVVVVLIVVFVGVPLPVSGSSMEPNFHNSELVMIQRLNITGQITRGDVVEAKFPGDPSHTKLIKRVIGLPGETVSFDELGHVSINGTLLTELYGPIYGQIPAATNNNVTLGSGQYFLMGDNRPGSSDSRIWGPVESSDIQGKIVAIVYPIRNLSLVSKPKY